jgi:hypothetical protein
LLVALTVALLGGITAWQSGLLSDDRPTDLPAPFPSPHEDWAGQITAIDNALEIHRLRAGQEPTDWLSPAAEAAALIDRAQLTGRIEDWIAAEAALALSMERSPPAARPHPLAARLALALHRNDAVEPALQAATADLEFAQAVNQSDAMMLRADVALYRGAWRQADALLTQAQSLADDPALHARRAFIIERTGDPDDAVAAWIGAAYATDRPSHRLLSGIAARIGGIELARGNWEAAARWYDRAERLMPGDWRIAALRLQMRALDGDVAGAARDMAALAERHDRPELWDAAAAWQKASGGDGSAALARAAAGWQMWQERYPQAVAAHIAEHYLSAGNTAAAIASARANHANRPYGDAAVLLASALSAGGEVAQARRLLEPSMASGWRSVEGDRLAFELAALAGDGDAAETARDAALARNPRAFDPAMALIRFGLH